MVLSNSHSVKKDEPHLSGYQNRDYEIVDYQMYELGETGLKFRGPVLSDLTKDGYIACVGAAQTLGCFCERPYPKLLSEDLDIPVLNLGYGGAGPEFFDKQDSLLEYVNNSKALVFQVMSGRSQSNSQFESGGLEYLTSRVDGRKVSAQDAYSGLIEGKKRFHKVLPERVASAISRRLSVPHTRKLVDETRKNWVESNLSFMRKVQVPTVLLWFSKRQPYYVTDYLSISGLFSDYPQLINQEMVNAIKGAGDHYVECVTERGFPQRLISRFSGEPVSVDPSKDRPDLGGDLWSHDYYYPSPEMHEDAARSLYPLLKALVS